MKKNSLLLFFLIFFIHNAHCAPCTGGTYISATGTINDGLVNSSITLGTQTLTGFIGGPWRPGAGLTIGMRVQYLYSAAELTAAGIVAGPITSLAWNVTTGGGIATIPNFTIRMGSLPFPFLINAYDPPGAIVYGPVTINSPTVPGLVTYTFSTPYLWDGTSNILVEICHSPSGVIVGSPEVSQAITGFVSVNQRTTASGCSQINGTLQSNRPITRFGQVADYDNNSSCNYLISPGAGFNNITLNFSEFLTESVSDYVEVYDGPAIDPAKLLGVFSGNMNASLPSVTSLTNQMLVRFISNGSVTFSGWAANYIANIYCGGTTVLTPVSGSFSDGSGAANSLANSNCRWLITPGASYDNVTLDLTNINMGSDVDDFIKIWDNSTGTGSPLATFSGGGIGGSASYTSTGQSFFVQFFTDGDANTANGFVDYSASFSSGNICVKARNSCGTSSSNCISVKAKALAPVTIVGPAGVCVNQAGVNYSTPAVFGAVTYVWTVPYHATIVSGQGTPSIVVNFSHYTGNVSVYTKNLCGSSSTKSLKIKFICREAGEVSEVSSNEINVYPNPTHGSLNLNITSEINQKCNVKLVDLIGKQLMFESIELVAGSNLHQYEVSGYAKGIYMMVIEREGMASETIRVVVE